MKVYVNAYLVVKKYGGAEEGGWYYDHYSPLQSRQYESNDPAELVNEAMFLKEDMAWYNRELNDNNTGITVRIENKEYETQTLEVPHFE